MTQLQSVQPPSSQPQGAGQCFISPVMLSHLTLPATWQVVEAEEKHRDSLRLTKDNPQKAHLSSFVQQMQKSTVAFSTLPMTRLNRNSNTTLGRRTRLHLVCAT